MSLKLNDSAPWKSRRVVRSRFLTSKHHDQPFTQPLHLPFTPQSSPHLHPSISQFPNQSLALPVLSYVPLCHTGTSILSASPLYPRSSATSIAAFSPISSAVLYVLHPTLSGQMDRSAHLRPRTPWTLRRSSRTPCLTIELPWRGAMEQVPRPGEG